MRLKRFWYITVWCWSKGHSLINLETTLSEDGCIVISQNKALHISLEENISLSTNILNVESLLDNQFWPDCYYIKILAYIYTIWGYLHGNITKCSTESFKEHNLLTYINVILWTTPGTPILIWWLRFDQFKI